MRRSSSGTARARGLAFACALFLMSTRARAHDVSYAHLELRWTAGRLDGELTVFKRQEIRRHLDDCPPCAKGFDFEMELRQVIASKCRDEVPVELRERIAIQLGIVQVEGPLPE